MMIFLPVSPSDIQNLPLAENDNIDILPFKCEVIFCDIQVRCK